MDLFKKGSIYIIIYMYSVILFFSVFFAELKTGSKILVDGKLQRKIRYEESMWSLEPGKCVVINLEKYEERFWTAVIEGDPEIDKTKVDTTRCITDFDEQTQCDYERVMYDHHQKLQGKPTSQEKVRPKYLLIG